jgi:hypothetical protein
MITGSKGPMLRKATPLDWAGDRFDPKGFFMEHGEEHATSRRCITTTNMATWSATRR